MNENVHKLEHFGIFEIRDLFDRFSTVWNLFHRKKVCSSQKPRRQPNHETKTKIKRNLHINFENLKLWNFCQPKVVLSKLCDFQKSALISSKQPPVQRMFFFCNIFKTLSHDDKKSIVTKRFGSFLGTFDIFCLTEAFCCRKFSLISSKSLWTTIFFNFQCF